MQLMTTRTQSSGVLPYCTCQCCHVRAPAAVWRRHASTDGVREPSERRAQPSEFLPPKCQHDTGEDNQQPPLMQPLRSDDSSPSASLCCAYDDDYARAALGSEAAAAVHRQAIKPEFNIQPTAASERWQFSLTSQGQHH